MKNLRLALVLGIFTLTAAPAQAAQVCEAEIQEVMRTFKAGGRPPNMPETKKDALESVQFSMSFDCDPEGTLLVKRSAAKTAVDIQQLEKLRSEVAASDPDRAARIDQILLDERAELARMNLVVCGAEANDTKKCNGRVVAMGGKKDPYPKVGEGGPNDPKPAPAPRPGNGSPGIGTGIIAVPLPKLSSAQIAACSEEIRRTQLASQGWAGDANQVAARLGRFQKDLFEGRCAGHPEAAAYIAGADKMLSYTQAGSSGTTPSAGSGTNAAGTAGLSGGSSGGAPQTPSPSATGGNSKQHNAAHNANDCVAVYHESEMKALGYKNIMRSLIVNTCSYPISVQWCVQAGNGGTGDCKPGYSNLADLGARGTRGIDSNYQAVRYAACRLGPNMGFLPVAKDPRDPFRFACS